jgi:ribosome-associated toxin RatA of RatAB toxin-antitoxin module
MIRATPFICLVTTPLALLASDLEFPDSSGKIVDKTPEYVIRLVETPSSNLKTAEAVFIVKGAPQTCLKVVSDFGHYPQFMPNIVASELVEKKDSCVTFSFGFRVALWTIRYTNLFRQRVFDDSSELDWSYVNGDLKETRGSWKIRRCPGKPGYSVVRYKAFINTGMFVPRWVSDLLTAKSIPNMIKAIAERVQTEEAG